MTLGNTNFRFGCDVVSFVDDLNKIRRFGKKNGQNDLRLCRVIYPQEFCKREISASRVLQRRSIAPNANTTFPL